MQSMHCALSQVEQASQRCFTSMDRRVADMGDRLERFEKQCANHDEQVSALKHSVATAMVAQPQDAQVFDESLMQRVVRARTKHAVSAMSLFQVVSIKMELEAQAVTMDNDGPSRRFEFFSVGNWN